MYRIVLFLTLTSSFLFALWSGSVEGFGSRRSIALVAVVFLNLMLMSTLMKMFYDKIRNKRAFGGKSIQVVAGILISLGLIIFGLIRDRASQHATQTNGERIIKALEKYKTQHGIYPTELQDLSADGLNLPIPAIQGPPFKYIRTERGFTLSFPSYSFLICVYESDRGAWRCDD